MPAIASLDSPQVPRAQVMVSTIRKAKEGVKRHGRGYNSKMYSYTMAKLARGEYATKRHSGRLQD